MALYFESETVPKVYNLQVITGYLHESEADNGPSQAHQNAFVYICNYINENIVKGGNVTRMTMLYEKYLQLMQDNSPEYYNA